jgi:hypothetical protein
VEQRVRAAADLRGYFPVLDYGVIADKDLYFSGNTTFNIKIHANRDLTISGNPTVNGDVTAQGILIKGSAVVNGRVDDNAPTVPFPTLDTADLRNQALALGSTGGSSPTILSGLLGLLGGSTSRTLSGYYGSRLEVNANRIVINGVVWAAGDVVLKADDIVGDGVLITEGKLTIGDTGSYSGTLPSTNVLLVSIWRPTDPTTVVADLSGQTRIKGGLYAPYGKVNLSGGATFVDGGIAAQYANVSGNFSFVNSGAFSSPHQLGTRADVKFWQEL